MADKKMRKMPIEFICEKCDFKCYKRSNFDAHLGTAKHRRIKMDKKEELTTYNCECGKKYNYQSGLCKHKKKCTYKTQELLAETLKHQKEEQLKLLHEQKEEQIKLLQEQKEEQRKRDEQQKEEQRKLLQEQKEE